ncbi:MAG: TonB family protein [Bacteroidales bacterium]|nr:TonB family protein [Bacteroidales bacterium]
MLRFIKEHKNGIIGTLIFHGVIALLFIFLGFSTPLPLPAEQGIMINFGNVPDAAGSTELRQAVQQQRSQPQEQTQPRQSPPETSQQEAPKETEEQVQTQDFEEAPAVEEKTQETSQNEDERPQEQEDTKQQTTEQNQEKEQQDTQEEEQEPERQVNEQALYSGKSKEQSGESEGETQGEGNQGRESGTPYSDNHANVDSRGMGGIDFTLEGRNPESLPKPEYQYQVEGKVVVEITVDKQGNVKKAEAGMKGSTTLNDKLLRAARKAALNARFDPKPDAPAYQKGTITYYFRLQ